MANQDPPISRDYLADEVGREAFQAGFARHVSSIQRELVGRFLKPENTQRLRHGGEWQHPGNPQAFSGGIQQHSASLTAKFEDIVNGDLGMINHWTRELAQAMHSQFAKMLYSTVSDACDQVGNTVDAKSAGSLEESVFRMIEKLEFSVSRDGTVQLPEIHASPDLALRLAALEANAAAEYKERFQALIARKTAEALAREVDRKAKFYRYGE